MGHEIGYPVVGDLLHESGYGLQAKRKSQEGMTHPDRPRRPVPLLE